MAQHGPAHSALIMIAFGLDTSPTVIAGAYGAGRGIAMFGRRGTVTAGGPWLMSHIGMHAMHWLPFDCTTC